MTTDVREVVSALIDREWVDADQLARVLEDADARGLLVDFVRLRAALAEDEDTDPAAPVAGIRAFATRGGWWRRAVAAFVLLGAGLGGGIWVGERMTEERPPAPDRVIEFTPGIDWHPTTNTPRGGL